MKKTEIIPAVLPRDFNELNERAEWASAFSNKIQVDVCDGQFVPNATWPYKKEDENFKKILNEEQGLPFWEKLDYEIDLMANRPEEIVSDWVMAGASRLILHVESKGDLQKAIDELKDKIEIGMAINIETPIERLKPFTGSFSSIQCMGIDRIGFQGQDFDSKVIEKIMAIREAFPDVVVSVDGGVSLETISKLKEAGASRFIVGSALWNSDNPFEYIKKLER